MSDTSPSSEPTREAGVTPLFFIIWEGAGPLVPVIYIAVVAAALWIGPDKGTSHTWWLFGSQYVAAVLIFVVGAVLNDEYDDAHSLYIIPFQYWGWVVCVVVQFFAHPLLLRVPGICVMAGVTWLMARAFALDEAALERRREKRRKSADKVAGKDLRRQMRRRRREARMDDSPDDV